MATDEEQWEKTLEEVERASEPEPLSDDEIRERAGAALEKWRTELDQQRGLDQFEKGLVMVYGGWLHMHEDVQAKPENLDIIEKVRSHPHIMDILNKALDKEK